MIQGTAVERSALLVRSFVEDYHAMLEEQFVFRTSSSTTATTVWWES